MSREFGDLEDEIESYSKKDFRVASETQKSFEEFKRILGILRARNLHKKTRTNWLIENTLMRRVKR